MASRPPTPSRPPPNHDPGPDAAHFRAHLWAAGAIPSCTRCIPPAGGDAARDYDGAAFLDKLSSLPLLYQPATVWDYGFGLDVLGLTIEKISKQSLGQISAGQPVRAARHDRHWLYSVGR